MNSNDKNMDLTFIDRKERKIQSPSREVVSPNGHLYIPIGSPGQGSPGSGNQCLSQKLSNSEEDTSNNNGTSVTDNSYFGDAFPSSLTSEQEAALLRELEQDSVTETSGHLQFDMRYIDRKEANTQDISQHGSGSPVDKLTDSQLQLDSPAATGSRGNRGGTFLNSITMEINSAMSSPYVSVLSNPLSFKDEEEEEKCDSKSRAYEIRSTTSVMLFQERNLFADEKEAAEAGDTSSEGMGEDSVQLDHSDSWRSESMAAKFWRQADSQSSSAAEDLPEVEVFPAVSSVDDITDSKLSELSDTLLVQESFSATCSVPSHSRKAVSKSVSPTDRGTEQGFTQGRSSSQHVDLNQEVKEEVVSNTAMAPQMTQPIPAVATQSKSTPVKMIEVERKFVITGKCVDKLMELGASLNVEKTFTDRYYDDSKYSLTLQDWFRQRNQDWELKVARRMSCTLSTQYEEITKEEDIIKYLIQHFNVDGFTEDLITSVSSLVKIVGLQEFATFTTHRQSYSLPECTVDLDITDFGFQVGEIEVMVTNETRIPSALNTIEDMAKKLGFQCLSKLQ